MSYFLFSTNDKNPNIIVSTPLGLRVIFKFLQIPGLKPGSIQGSTPVWGFTSVVIAFM